MNLVVGDITSEIIESFDSIIVTEIFTKSINLFKINELCREHGLGFILGICHGIFGCVFVDFGDTHLVTAKENYERKEA